MAIVTLKTGTSSADLISDDGRSEFYERRERRDLCAEEIKATLDLLWSSRSNVKPSGKPESSTKAKAA